ncbi:MAG: transcriptional repressor [Candidatus Eisenbacteria sp.]|nr:transcriptional repressor [Candidatus Eisenbacteria bacterium]
MQPTQPEHVTRLRRANIKVTRIRIALLDLLAAQERHMTADEITVALRKAGVRADRVTVYRNIDRMIQDGLLVPTLLPGRALHVGLCTRPDAAHHHHVVCERCGRVAETDGCPVREVWERLSREIQEQRGFQLTDHITQYVGICPECQRKGIKPRQ